jgi:hypothetical protein
MDERALKRLLIIVAVSIIAIFLFKIMMSNTIVKLNKAVAEKKQAVAKPPSGHRETPPTSDTSTTIEMSAASSVGENTTQDSPSAY